MPGTQIIKGGPLAAIHWKRGCMPTQDYTEDATLNYPEAYDLAESGPLMSGMVATVRDGNVAIAATGGKFRGFFHSEVSPDIDDTLSGAPAGVVVSNGSGKARIYQKALVEGMDYPKGAWVTSGTGVNAGRLVSQADDIVTEATVGYVQESNPAYILVAFRAPTI